MIGSRRREMGLGGYPGVTLAMARETAREARDLIRRGIDPIEAAKDARAALMVKPTVGYTFKAAAEAYIAAHEASWKNSKHRDQWTATLKNYAYPAIGKLDVAAIELPHIMRILEPIWVKKTETATRIVVAHRPALLKRADRVLVVRGGALVTAEPCAPLAAA